MLPTSLTDLQAAAPSLAVALDTVGVTGVVRGIVLGGDMPTTATFDVTCSLGPDARGAHMSRFHEAVDQALALAGDDGADVLALDVLAAVIAMRAADLQGADRATAAVRATLVRPRISPGSGRRSLDPFDVWASVEIDTAAGRSSTTLGVTAVGMTACPCAQHLVADAARERMRAAGVDEATIDTALSSVPVATHNQRSTASLAVTVPGDGAVVAVADPLELVELVRGSMSAPIHELLKRSDELAVVEAAHEDPRFVEDCVRALLRDAVVHGAIAALPDATELTARQVNHESIHAHDVVAARRATLGGLRGELGIRPEPA